MNLTVIAHMLTIEQFKLLDCVKTIHTMALFRFGGFIQNSRLEIGKLVIGQTILDVKS